MSAAFLLASLLLAVTPGPGVAYIVSRTLAQGRAAGFASALGVAVGNVANAVGASIGLAALFAASAVAFTVVKFAGAAYLIWLGLRVLRSGEERPQADDMRRPPAEGDAETSGGRALAQAPAGDALARFAPVSATRLFRDGALVACLNPKTALFFAAFLPQFMQAGAPALPQAVVLSAVFVGIAALTDIGYVMLTSTAAKRFARRRSRGDLGSNSGSNLGSDSHVKWGRRASGAMLIGLGLFTAASPTSAGSCHLVAAKPC